MILASCSYEESRKYNGKLIVKPTEGLTKKKQEEVQLNIVTDDPEYVFKHGIGVANCITTTVSPSYCPDSLKGKVFRVYNYHEGLIEVNEQEGIIPLIVLPEGFDDMRKVETIMEEFSDSRVIGGNLLEIPGFRIGRYDKGKEKMSSVFNGIYDIFKEVELNSIEVQEIMNKPRSKGTIKSARPKKDVVRKVTTKEKKKKVFDTWFGEEEDEF